MRRHLLLAVLVALFFLTGAVANSQTDLTQVLRDQYQGKTFVLRGFYTGDQVVYTASGDLVSHNASGDWTTDGFVNVQSVQILSERIILKARRMLIEARQGTFQLRAAERLTSTPKKTQPVFVSIEAAFETNSLSAEEINAAFSKIFLTSQDSLVNLLPEYWKSCVTKGLRGEIQNCTFSTELMATQGVAFFEEDTGRGSSSPSSLESSAAPAGVAGKQTEFSDHGALRVGSGVKPPKAISAPEPDFSDAARAVRCQGVMTLALIVDKDGVPRRVHILSPLGCGLDAKAVHAVETWRFQPAEKDGQPVPVEIAIEVNFHLY